MDQDGTWHGGGPWSRPHCGRWGPSSPPQKGGTAPQFSAHVCCGQTAGWIKMPLGTMVGLGPGNRCGPSSPPPKRDTTPNFRPMSMWPNGRSSQLPRSTCKNIVKVECRYFGGNDATSIVGYVDKSIHWNREKLGERQSFQYKQINIYIFDCRKDCIVIG